MSHASLPPASSTPPAPPSKAAPGPERRGRRARREILLIMAAAIALGAVVAFATLPSSRPTASSAPSGTPTPSGGYLTSLPELRERALRAAAGLEPDASAVTQLLADADAALARDPAPVGVLVITGDDGPFVEDGVAAYGLALAWGLTGDARYGERSAAVIRAWVGSLTAIGDACPDNGSCHTSLIVSRTGADFVFAADLLEGAPFWTTADREALSAWLTGVVLPAASERTNNWGDAGTLLRVAITDYAGDRAGFEKAIAHWRALMDLVTADGEIPEETRRGTDGMQYTQEALQYKVAVAEIAGRRGIDLWSYRGAGGGSLRGAVDTLAWYWFHPDTWPWNATVDVPSPGPMWELVYAEWRNPAYLPILDQRRPYGDLGHSALRWTTLTSGVPTETADGATPTPDVTATPAPTPTPTIATLGSPAFRIVDLVSSNRLTVDVAWPITGEVPQGTRVAIAAATSGKFGTPATAAPGNPVPIRLSVGTVTHVRAALVDPDGQRGPWSDATSVVVRRYDDVEASFAYEGTWEAAAFRSYVGGTVATSSEAGATVTLSLDGLAVALLGPTGPTRGRGIVIVDGAERETIDTRSSRFVASALLVDAAWPAAGPHTVSIRVLGDPPSRPTVAIDAALVLEAAP